MPGNATNGLTTLTPANYTAGCSKPSSVPSFYCCYSIVVAASTARTIGTAQWTNAAGDVASVNAGLATQASAAAGPAGDYFVRRHPGPKYG